MSDQVSVVLKGLAFGFRSGLTRTEVEDDGIVSVTYGVEPTAVATFEMRADMLNAPVQFDLRVVLGERGEEDAVTRAKAEVRRFLEAMARARVNEGP